MKTAKSIILAIVCCVSVLLTCFLPACEFAGVSAEELPLQQTLISQNLTTTDFTNVYGGTSTNELSDFTPFDESVGERMRGKSIAPISSDHNIISSTKYNLLENGGLDAGANELSFGGWFYFSTVFVHQLTIKISVDDNNYFKVVLPRGELTNILRKNSESVEPGFGWNYIEFPILSNCVVGTITDADGKFKEFDNIEINYTHDDIIDNVTYASLKMFGLDIISSTVDVVTATVKQDYSIYSFKFWDEETLSNLVQGDTLRVPNLANAVEYAWYGEIDLTTLANVSWRALVTAPSKKESTYNITGTENINLSEKGEYVVVFRAFKQNGDDVIDLYDTIKFRVISSQLMYFQFASYDTFVDGKKILTIDFSPLLDESSIEFVDVIFDDDIIEVSATQNKLEYEIVGKKKGTSQITIKFLAKRNTNSSEMIEYSATARIDVEAARSDGNVIFVVCAIALGAILLFGLIYGIKTVVKARKNDVK